MAQWVNALVTTPDQLSSILCNSQSPPQKWCEQKEAITLLVSGKVSC